MGHSISEIRARYAELSNLLESPDTLNDPDKIREISTEHAKLSEILKVASELDKVSRDLAEAKTLLLEAKDEETKNFLQEEIEPLQTRNETLASKLNNLLNPANPEDLGDAIVEIRAAAGGEEAGLFAAELCRMYLRFAERHGFQAVELDLSTGGIGNIKEAILKISGPYSYGLLKFESGVHRVQRVPKTESSGRIHTSTATVAVLPAVTSKEFSIDPKDIEFEAFRSSGAGGQNVNKVNTAVRLKHNPSGLVVTAQSERSQLQNRERAMEILRSRLYAAQKEAERQSMSVTRKEKIGSGDRSEKIRTYNFPQDRITDHRIGESFHHIEEILDGKIDLITAALQAYETKKHSHPSTSSG